MTSGKRFKLTIAYDGRPFEGWQSQPSGQTVQDHLEKALGRIAKAPLSLHGSGRTDTGVHALGQVAHFDAPDGSRMIAEEWQRALNANLPSTIRILRSESVDDDFHARFGAKKKTYRYEIDTGEVQLPLRAGLAWHHPRAFDRAILREAAALFAGEHDFVAFAASRGDGKEVDAVRTILAASVEEEGGTVVLTFTGTGFLYRMVRLLTGSAMRCATGSDPVAWLQQMLDSPTGKTSPYCAPADGLYLVSVGYD